MKILSLMSALLLLALLGGCKVGDSASNTAVVDIERVAKETGLSEKVNKELEEFQQGLQAKLNEVQGSLTTQIDAKKKEIGEKPSEKQREELAQLFNNARQQFQQAQQGAAKNLEGKRASLIISVRDQIRPVARKVAKARGMSVILAKSDILILDYDRAADITDAVISEMLIKPATAPAAASEAATPPADTPAGQ